jgi:replicative DNA helicase
MSDRKDAHRMLPQSADAEKGLICSAILRPADVLSLCEDRGVSADWFHIPAHALVFEILRVMQVARMPVDLITLTQALRENEWLDQVGGAAYVTELFTFLPTAANAAHYLETVAKKHCARRLIATCTEYAGRAYEESGEIGELLDEAQAAILALNRPDADASQESIQHIKTGVLDALTAIEETYHTKGGVVGLRTGFHQIDRMTGGLRGPQLVIIGGRPSMGKTALAMNMAEYIAVEGKKPVLVFSLEMNITELASRIICGRAKVNLQRVRDGFMSKEQIDTRLPAAVKDVVGAPIYVDETAGISIQQLRPRVRRFIKKYPDTACVVIDYLQLMKSATRRGQENRNQEVSEISGGLKNLAKEINRPIIVGAQLNRDNDGANNPPKLSNLRESGSIEQDADLAILLHRRHYYTKDDEDKGKATADLAKQRNGPTGKIELVFNAELARFENPEGQEFYSNDPTKRQHEEGE